MTRRKKDIKYIENERKEKILRWLNWQDKEPSYEKWDETTLSTLNNWSEKPEFGDEVNFLAQSLYLRYLKEVCLRQCIRKHGKEEGERIIKKKRKELRALEAFCNEAKFHAKHLSTS